jgi:hypothetical protein
MARRVLRGTNSLPAARLTFSSSYGQCTQPVGLNTAKALGLTVPLALLATADELLE